MSVVMSSREASAVDPARLMMAEKDVGPSVVFGGERGFGEARRIMGVGGDDGGGGESSSSSESSSIGEAEEESSLSVSTSSVGVDRGAEEEVQSRWSKDSSLGSLESLEDALPIKRGLSSFFNGKSKSFASLLSEAASTAPTGGASDLAKAGNPFNKRRRILVSCRPSWRRRASYASLLCSSSTSSSSSSSSSPSVPAGSTPVDLSSLESEGEEEEEEEGEVYGGGREESGGGGVEGLYRLQQPRLVVRFHEGNKEAVSSALRSSRSYSLCDLRHHAKKEVR